MAPEEKKLEELEEKDQTHHDPACAICGQPCKLEECVTDERGRAVHKECYRALLSEKAS